MDAVVRPIADDWAQGNKAIRSIRNRYPTIDAAVGLHPVVAASQLANDVMSNDIGVDSGMNVLQAVPIVKRLSGLEKLLSKQSGPVVGGTKFVVDVPSTVRKNVVLTGAQAIGQPGEAFARGGIIPVRGKGTGTSDSIPAVLAGHEVRVSNGEGVAVLPAKTMRTPGALDAVEGIIAATNKSRHSRAQAAPLAIRRASLVWSMTLPIESCRHQRCSRPRHKESSPGCATSPLRWLRAWDRTSPHPLRRPGPGSRRASSAARTTEAGRTRTSGSFGRTGRLVCSLGSKARSLR
jgi:hypothetical protein